MGEATAKPRLLMAVLGQAEERDSCFTSVKLLVLIKDVGWENIMRLYLNKMRYEMGSHWLSIF